MAELNSEQEQQTSNRALQTRQVDLGELANATSGEVKLKVESPEELTSRLRKDEKQHDHDLRKDTAVFYVTVVGAGVVLIASLYFLNSPTSTPEAKEWAGKALPSLVTAFLGFLVGKKAGTPESRKKASTAS